MSWLQVVLCGAVSSVVCGVICAWGVTAWLVLTGAEGLVGPGETGIGAPDAIAWLLLVVLLTAIWGGAAGAVMGLGPTTVVALAWGFLQSRLGSDGAVRAATVLASAVVLGELLWALGWSAAAVSFAVPCAALAGGCAFVTLRASRRSTRARTARGVVTAGRPSDRESLGRPGEGAIAVPGSGSDSGGRASIDPCRPSPGAR